MKELVYTDLPLPSGALVSIRARTWPEWEGMERARIDKIRQLKAAAGAASLDAVPDDSFGFMLDAKIQGLGYWVKDFEQIKSGLSMRDIALIEQEALKLEALEIPMGNSGAGSAGL